MGDRFRTVFLAGLNVNRLRLKSQAAAVVLGQPTKLFDGMCLLASQVESLIRSGPILSDERLVEYLDAFFGASARSIILDSSTANEQAGGQ